MDNIITFLEKSEVNLNKDISISEKINILQESNKNIKKGEIILDNIKSILDNYKPDPIVISNLDEELKKLETINYSENDSIEDSIKYYKYLLNLSMGIEQFINKEEPNYINIAKS